MGMAGLPALAAEDEGMEFFEKRIRPVLVNECLECHSSQAKTQDKLKGGLLIDSKADLLRGEIRDRRLFRGSPTKACCWKP